MADNFEVVSHDEAVDLETLVNRVNGFVYHGDRMNAALDTIKVLRKDPELAARLLGFTDRQEWAYWYQGPNPMFFTRPQQFTREEAEDMRDVFLEEFPDVDGRDAQVISRRVWISEWEVVTGGEAG